MNRWFKGVSQHHRADQWCQGTTVTGIILQSITLLLLPTHENCKCGNFFYFRNSEHTGTLSHLLEGNTL